MATEEDKKMAENWKDDADGILIFVHRYLLFLHLLLRQLVGNRQDYSPLRSRH
jgi:hypothetical protein